MDALAQESRTPAISRAAGMSITVEVAMIAALVLVAAGLRLLSLGEMPMTTAETPQALAAYRAAFPQSLGDLVVSDQPVMDWTQRFTFAVLGGGEGASRLGTALAGILLALSPLLFRDLFGRPRTYIMALILTLSPVAMAAARLSGPATWSMLFVVIGLWGLWRYWQSAQGRDAYALISMAMLGALVLLAEPGGPVLALILLGAGGAALSLTVLDAPDEVDVPGNERLIQFQEHLAGWPWRSGGVVILLLVIAVGTGFMLHPSGLSRVAALINGFVTGWSHAQPDAPLFFPLQAALFYDTWLWIFAAGAVVVHLRHGLLTFTDRFLMGWVVFALIASVIYRGAGASHALWLVMPLAALSASLVAHVFTRIRAPAMWLDDLLDDDEQRSASAGWGRWVLVLMMLALLVMASLHFQFILRGILNIQGGTPGALFDALRSPAFANVVNSMVWLVISLLFIIVGYFMAASIWGNVMPAQAGVIGLFIFVMFTNTGSAWRVGAVKADSALELWNVNGITADAAMLRQTMDELSFRLTRGIPELPIAVIADENGLIAWLLRDYKHGYFVDTVEAARAEQLVLMPEQSLRSPEQEELVMPDLGGSYVGGRYVLTEVWSLRLLEGMDFLPWWAMRRVRTPPRSGDVMVLWIRQDIYDGSPYEAPVSPIGQGVG